MRTLPGPTPRAAAAAGSPPPSRPVACAAATNGCASCMLSRPRAGPALAAATTGTFAALAALQMGPTIAPNVTAGGAGLEAFVNLCLCQLTGVPALLVLCTGLWPSVVALELRSVGTGCTQIVQAQHPNIALQHIKLPIFVVFEEV